MSDQMTQKAEMIHERSGEFVGGSSRKFYTVRAYSDGTYEFLWGRIGSRGQKKVQRTYSGDAAIRKADEQFAKKRAKGYKEVQPLELLARTLEDENEIEEDKGLGVAEIRVPNQWAMFSAAGNRRLKKLAEKFVEKLNRLRTSYNTIPYAAYRKQANALLKQYVKEWARVASTKSYPEAGDTAVRECVGDFFDRLRANVGISTWDLVEWDDVY